MRTLHLLATVLCLTFSTTHAQTTFREIASNRMIQKYQSQKQLEKIEAIDPVRLQTLYSYFTASFTFSSDESDLDVTKLLNIYHFDVFTVESQRNADIPVTFTFHDNITITLKSGTELQALLQGYDLIELVNSIPPRPFPLWTASSFSEQAFQTYKEQVWDWARDYPEAYMAYTSNTSINHIHFNDIAHMPAVRQTMLLESGPYIIVD